MSSCLHLAQLLVSLFDDLIVFVALSLSAPQLCAKLCCNRPISQREHELHSGNISCGDTRNINSLLFKRNKHVKSWLS